MSKRFFITAKLISIVKTPGPVFTTTFNSKQGLETTPMTMKGEVSTPYNIMPYALSYLAL